MRGALGCGLTQQFPLPVAPGRRPTEVGEKIAVPKGRHAPATDCWADATSAAPERSPRSRAKWAIPVPQTQIRVVARRRLLLAKARREDGRHPGTSRNDRQLPNPTMMRTIRASGGRVSGSRGSVSRAVPTISLVVAMDELQQHAEAALSALVSECGRTGIELVVACKAGRRSLDTLRRRHPTIRFSTIESAAARGDIRAMGLRDATGEIVVVFDADADTEATGRIAALLARSVEQPTQPSATAGRASWDLLLQRVAAGASAIQPVLPDIALPPARAANARSHAAAD